MSGNTETPITNTKSDKDHFETQTVYTDIINCNGCLTFTNTAEPINNRTIGEHGTGNNSEIFNSYEGSGKNVASGKYSHAEGYFTTASGESSHAEGWKTTSSGLGTHAEGCETKVSSNIGSHAEGSNTSTTQAYSHAEGYKTTSVYRSHAEGCYTTASSRFSSYAEGYDTITSSNYSHAQNYYTTTDYNNMTAIGSFNVPRSNVYRNIQEHIYIADDGTYTITKNDDGTYTATKGDTTYNNLSLYKAEPVDIKKNKLFVVGNGNSSAAEDAFIVTETGDVFISGNLYINDKLYYNIGDTNWISNTYFDSIQ